MHCHNLRIALLLIGLAIFRSAQPSAGQEVEPAASRAQLLAPFLEDETFVVARIDLESIDIHWLFELARKLPDFGRTYPFLPSEEAALRVAKAFRASGAKDLYLLLSVKDLDAWKPSALVPLPPGSKPDAIAAALKDSALRSLLPFQITKQLGDVVFAGDSKTLLRMRTLKASPRPELQRALATVAGETVQLAWIPTGGNRHALEQWALPLIAGDANARPWLREAPWAAFGFSVPPRTRLTLSVGVADVQAAERTRLATDALFVSQGQRENVRQIWPRLDELSQFFVWEHDGAALRVSLDDSQGRLSALADAAVLQPLLAATAAKRARLDTIDHFKELEIALHNFYYQHKSLPPAAICDKDGKPLLSWRVAVLPYLEQPSAHDLYHEFHLAEPWNSPHNKTLLAKMPSVYRCPKSSVAGSGRTVYLVPRGNATVFPGVQGLKFVDVVDGLSLTIDLVEVDDEHAVTWTRPDDWSLDPGNPTVGLGGHFPGLFVVGLCDGSVQTLRSTIDHNTLRALFTRNGGEVVMWPHD